MGVSQTYVEQLNHAREARGLSMDELARQSGYPLDLVEPLLRGRPEAVSERMNKEMCEVLDLDAERMWALAQRNGPANQPCAQE